MNRLEELAKTAGLESFYVEYSPWQVEFMIFAHLLLEEVINVLDQDDGATHHKELLLSHFSVKSRQESNRRDKENIYNLPNSYIEVTEQEEEEFRSLEARSK